VNVEGGFPTRFPYTARGFVAPRDGNGDRASSIDDRTLERFIGHNG
jgi:hypothetical protein